VTPYLEFEHPWILAFLVLLPLYALLRGRMGAVSALRFSSAEVARAAGVATRAAAGGLLFSLRLLAIGLCVAALAGPRFAHSRTESRAAGIDIMLVVDLSWSMMALDMSPPGERLTRWKLSKGVIEDFIRRRPADRIGLIVFSGVPYLASPLTLNHDWLLENFGRMHIGMIRELGTAIGDAVLAGAQRMRAQKNSRSRVMILLTDGDNNKGDVEPVPAAEVAGALRMKIYTIGLGREAPCDLPLFNPETGELTLGPNGEVTRWQPLNPANYDMLSRMSQLTGGRSYRAENRRRLEDIYEEIDSLEKSDVLLERLVTYTPLFQWPLVAAGGLFALEVILACTRYRRVP
jgi:Ca-activated chloride channel family protein